MAISFLQTVIVAGPAKIGQVGTDNLTILSKFFHLYILSFDSTVMILSEFVHSVAGILMQATQCKFCIPYTEI